MTAYTAARDLAASLMVEDFADDVREAAALNANGIILRAFLFGALAEDDPRYVALSSREIDPADLVDALNEV